MDVEQSMMHSVFQDEDDDDDDLQVATFPDPIDLPDDFKMEEPFPPMPTSGNEILILSMSLQNSQII